MWSSLRFCRYWETLKWSDHELRSKISLMSQTMENNIILLVSTCLVLYPGHWLKMDQPLIYFASWEGDQVLHDEESNNYYTWQSSQLLSWAVPAKDKSPDICGAWESGSTIIIIEKSYSYLFQPHRLNTYITLLLPLTGSSRVKKLYGRLAPCKRTRWLRTGIFFLLPETSAFSWQHGVSLPSLKLSTCLWGMLVATLEWTPYHRGIKSVHVKIKLME